MGSNKNNNTINFILILSLIIASSCAQVSSPSGGKTDAKPPKVKHALPENRSVNFSSKKIEITFNEYVQLNSLNEQLIISPPLKKTPQFKIKNKSIVFEIKDTLKPNTTYTFNFGNAISDITESNKIENFQYVFSTGNTLDSLSISGTVKNALTDELQKDFLVLLYKTEDIQNDSFFSKQLPFYFSKTNDKGMFSIKNLGKAKYKIVALKDANANYLFDNPDESIAFLDSEIDLQESINDINLFSFKEEVKKIFVKNAIAEGFGKILITINKPYQNLSVEELRPTENFINAVYETSTNSDSISVWIPNQKTDSLFLKVLVNKNIIDTLNLRLQKKQEQEQTKTGRSRGGSANFFSFGHQINISANTKDLFNLNQPLQIQFKQPIKKADFKGIELTKRGKTIPVITKFIDENKRKLQINANFIADSSYTLYIKKETFTDIFDLKNDSLVYNFTLQNLDNYGKIKLDITAPNKNFILQLLTKDSKVVKETFFTGNYIFIADTVLPQTYLIKIIEDTNNNKRWDTGDYYKQQQPEKIFLFSKNLDVRANWDLEEKWEIK